MVVNVNIINVNIINVKRYRNRTIAGESQNVHLAVKDKLKKEGRSFELIPEDLDVYKEALDLWLSPNLEEVKSVIDKMILYHSVLVSDIDNEPEFGDYTYGFYPYEILFLMHIRRKLGLPVPDKFEDLLMNTPEAKVVINEPEPYPEWDPLLRAIDEFYRKNYPNYIPNKHGKLFE
ncbi:MULTISPECIES: hypothetical protein [Acetivibrio]|jgi:hypothetical protein|uniref:Uncharacterized protein n=2 Tax=Acetivibrio thermocellus TaxID=1515 RepID=A3DJC6_ACET2|nr:MULTISPECIES: hypothetical protein [Acetivibrio]ABN54055.1 hypothetical protein Cthe_2856 [Acetivibrio thermocellus ATCC 27405]ALX09685.1 hypothetical protein AD2_02705 [Acetivibrio thermocellus AD2]ANV77458.1 hypothetical protein LQRI_2717 [Acetivibrio thermocellus DSM 2360]EIC03572.1 hypothetical protein YSBL_2756 [Acetivibrio thermocellus YS]PFH03968.1 hypothetical protein M972_112787 [Acetivibrio thermocellus AD2]